ncbi:unnamed protein product [Prorocentrum cordatum]|uniref:CRAL-TRIO domain-containing protein n=1 Tax=Prorocentrum cordatum TaxID=2364126 RepID=A0ABN9PLU1_9DINO|nr:unnamed protein product [Polarella glacialis]
MDAGLTSTEPFPEAAAQSLLALGSAFPDAPQAEVRRFALARPHVPTDAVCMYEDYVRWRASEGRSEVLAQAWASLPAYVFSGVTEQGPALDGTGVLFMELARYDVQAQPASVYVQGVCHLLDQALPPDAQGQITVVIDTRAGPGWPNPNPLQVKPFLQEITQILTQRYPERCRRIIVYPVPWVAGFLVKMAKRLMDPKTSGKLHVITGEGDGCPSAALRLLLSANSFPLHSWSRHVGLVPSDAPQSLDCKGCADEVETSDVSGDQDEMFFSASEDEESSEDDESPGHPDQHIHLTSTEGSGTLLASTFGETASGLQECSRTHRAAMGFLIISCLRQAPPSRVTLPVSRLGTAVLRMMRMV